MNRTTISHISVDIYTQVQMYMDKEVTEVQTSDQ